MLQVTFSMVFIVTLFIGCSRSAEKEPVVLGAKEVERELVGSYRGVYAGGTESIIMMENGIYSQTFVRSGVTNYVNEGRWSCRPDSDHYRIIMEGFRSHFDFFYGGASGETRGVEQNIHYYSGDRKLVISPDNGYFLTKEK